MKWWEFILALTLAVANFGFCIRAAFADDLLGMMVNGGAACMLLHCVTRAIAAQPKPSDEAL